MSDSHSYGSPTPEPEPSAPGPSNTNPRKRPRSEVSPEERREARAHRNRIAAQNSRDRKKAHFQHLEQRVAELEDENKRLRASMSLPSASTAGSTAKTKEEEEKKEKENAELRARIATLEQGLEAVVKAFTGQTATNGTTTMATAGVIPTQSSVPFNGVLSSSSTTTTPSSHPSTSATSTPPTTLTPSTDLSATTYPNVTVIRYSALDTDLCTPHSACPNHILARARARVRFHSPPSTGGEYTGSSPCFPAAGGSELSLDLYASALTPSQDTSSTIDTTTASSSDSSCPPIALDDAAMETLFREILVNAHHGQGEGEDIDAGAKAEGVPSVDLFEGAGQQQAQAQGTTEAEETASAQIGVGGDVTELMGSGGLVGSEMGFGMADMEFDFENIGMDMDTSGISATWLNDDTTRLLEGLVASASTSNDATEPSTPPTSMSWESFEASLKASGVY